MKKLMKLAVVLHLTSVVILASGMSVAQEEGESNTFIFTLIQNGVVYLISPIDGDRDVVTFYDYHSSSGHTPFMEDEASKIYLYKETDGEEVSLVMHHASDHGELDHYVIKMDFQGLPEEAYIALSDDPSSRELNLAAEPEGDWRHIHNSDGGVVSGLPVDRNWSITIVPEFVKGIAKWVYLTQTNTGVESIHLDMEKAIRISMSQLDGSDGDGCFIGAAAHH
ncbi:MAG: hypothetical protein SWE60_14160 [Thermodesulfobacteriota bacterium]|nr:hypothetical protein [Thermodesulfobacteriota bacterium]